MDKDSNRFHVSSVDMTADNLTSIPNMAAAQQMSVATGVALIPAHLQDLPNSNVTLFLSPIKESDSNSAHSTLQGGTATSTLTDWRNSMQCN